MGAKRTASPLPFACSCGQVHGTLSADMVNAGNHVVCFCKDCRAAQIHLGQPDPAPDPVHVLQTVPDGIQFDAGLERMVAMRLSPKGIFRWHASCCNTPMFGTLKSAKLPFVAVLSNTVADPDVFGPVQGRGFIPQPDGTVRQERLGATIWGIATRMLSARLDGRWKTTPFFDTGTSQPIVVPRVLTKDERKIATPR